MKNRLMSLGDKILLRKRSVIETIDDELTNVCRVEHLRHRGTASFLISLPAGWAILSLLPIMVSLFMDLTYSYLKIQK